MGKKETTVSEETFEPMAMQAEFNRRFGVKQYVDEDAYGRKELLKLRMKLITEEFREVMDELMDTLSGDGSRAKLAKELADLHYVLYGTESLLEIPAYDVMREVHRSNMSKLGADGRPVLNRHGKILKGPNYSPADIESVLGDGVAN
jgi:phosphoribosyl-ATP pyrophosphohydrolase